MAHPEIFEAVQKLCALLHPIQDEEFIVTSMYQPTAIPQHRTMALDTEIQQVIVHHQEYTHSLTSIIAGILPTDPFEEIWLYGGSHHSKVHHQKGEGYASWQCLWHVPVANPDIF